MLEENERNSRIADFFTRKAMPVTHQANTPEARPERKGATSCQERMMSNLRHYFSTAVKPVNPLDTPRLHSTNSKAAAPPWLVSPSSKAPVKPGTLQKLSNPLTKQALPQNSPEPQPKGKVLTSSPPFQVLRKSGDSVKTLHASALLPSFQIRNHGSLVPFCLRAKPNPPNPPHTDSRRNGCSESKIGSSLPGITSAGDGHIALGRSCMKRKWEQVGEGSRPCSSPVGCDSVKDLAPRLSDRGRPALFESSIPNCPLHSSQASTPIPASATPFKQLLDPPCREGKEGGEVHCRTPFQQGALLDKEGPKGSPTLERCSRRQLDLGPSLPTSSGGPIRADRPRREERSSTSHRDPFTHTFLSTAKVGTQHLDTTTSPPARVAVGVEDSVRTSPLFGRGFSDSAEDGALSDLELHPGAYTASSSSSSSSSSEDEPLLSLKEIMERSIRPPPHTPEKAAFSEPSTPVHTLPPPTGPAKRPVNYKNTFEQILKEKEENQRLREIELKLLVSCKEDLQKLAEEEDGDEVEEEAISLEHRAILRRFSVVSNGIPDVPPGEEVFRLSRFGRLFSQHQLDLRTCAVTPQNPAQTTLLQASPDEQLFLIGTGLLLKAYRCSPCQPAVTRWLFQMMSVHLDRRVSTQVLQSMKDIALIAADQTVVNNSRTFEVWVPSLQDVALVFLNMGVPFVTLFSLEALQPPFTEGDILQCTDFCSEEDWKELNPQSFPEHNFENVIKYLAACVALCPRAYSDQELLLLLTLVCRLSLESRLQLLPMEDVCFLLHHLVHNMRDWDSQLPQICLALTNLTEDHHNLRRLVQLLPDHKRGKQLRKHLSVSIISKLLNHRCTYKPVNTEFQLSSLRRYLPRMRPSLLLAVFFSEKKKEEDGLEGEDCVVSQDQQAYYLCYSLLALVNEASNFDTFPSSQKAQLQVLSAELDLHIKSDIREGERWLYRSKVQDFVARIYTRWQVVLHKCPPMQGKLRDYWQPLSEDTASSSQESQESVLIIDVSRPGSDGGE